MQIRSFLNISILIAACSMLPFFALAQEFAGPAESVGIAIDQSVLSFEENPGSSIEFKITVENISEKEQKMSLYAADLSMGDNNVVEILAAENEAGGMKEWIKYDAQDWILQPKEKSEKAFILNVPQDAIVGSHTAGIFFQAFPPSNVDNFQKPIVSGRIGVYVLLNVQGEISGKGNLNKFEAPVVAGKEEKFTAEFENAGNVYYIPHGEIKIKNLLTKKENVLEVPKHFVFPGKKYSFDIDWNPESVLGAYQVRAFFVDGEKKVHTADKFVFGKMFFLIPLAVLIIIGIIVKIVRRRRETR